MSAALTSTPRLIPDALATPFARPAPAGSRRGCRSSSAAAAAPSARPVASPWIARATNSQASDWAAANRTVAAISVPSEPSKTGRRPTMSDTRPASKSEARTPNAYTA